MKKKFKNTNFLEFIPKKNIEWEEDASGTITLLKEKTSKVFLKKIISFMKRDQFIKIRLDSNGSRVWKFIDGKRRISEICSELRAEGEFPSAEERVSYFIGLMKKSKFVKFV